ncbi:ribosome hibernation-promoting factor, HPF/YfiA family [Paenibacillus thermotolerans]|uniref:ribosome hibernation-promoting factor, HPF/YfiA family n=1 Tax=Paenibacillus thermotolerans TaxID=3027807 RepID=UPI00236750F2|nr:MULTISPECIES: ribosome-associated translation inhibitor RaiA [unclassified Paenibacillus]
MKFQIRGKNVEITNPLREYAERKVGRLEKYFEAPLTSEVLITLSVLKSKHTVEVVIPVNGAMLRAEERSHDMYASIDMVIDKLERQIRKLKTKINRKVRQEGTQRSVFKEAFEQAAPARAHEEDDPFEVVRTKRFNLKPMDVEEAVLQMNLLGHDFYVFSNSSTSAVNVVYRREDGKYGLIEPAV